MILCDTGPLVAAALDDDEHHQMCVELFTDLHLAGRALLVPPRVVAEVGYLLEREAGPRVEASFLIAVVDGDFELVDLKVSEVATLDRRHFSVVRPRHVPAFSLLP